MNIDEKLEESIENKYIKHAKDKNKMELTIEESAYILKRKDFNKYVEDIAIETLLTTYEKEIKELNDKINAKIEYILNTENGAAIEKLIEWLSLL